jgi:hypothetical protein
MAHGSARTIALKQPGNAAHRPHRAAEWRYAYEVTTNSDCELCADPGGDLLYALTTELSSLNETP